jgi:hypothetical protein
MEVSTKYFLQANTSHEVSEVIPQLITTLLYADDQVLISDSEDYLWRALYTLHNTTK